MAQTNLGNALMTGTGIAKDVARARVLLEKSVAAGDVIACFPLAISYFYGEGGAKDVVRAEQVAAEGARKGDPNCARFLRMIRNARTQQALQPDAPTPTANSTDGDSLKPALKAALAHWEEQRRSGDEAQAAALADALLAEIDEQVIAAADHETLVTVVFVLHETAGHRIQDAADPATALPSSQLAIRAGERLVFATGAYQHYPLLGAIYMNHGALLRSLKQDAEALAFQRRGVAGFQRIPDAHMTPKLLGYLMGALVNLADTSAALKQFSVAEAEYSAAMPRLRSAVSSGPTELAGLLAHLDGMHTGLKLESGTTTTAAAAHVEERLAAWLAADAPWHGEKWEAAIRKLIQLARNLRESVLGTAAAEEAAAAWLRALDGLRSRQRV